MPSGKWSMAHVKRVGGHGPVCTRHFSGSWKNKTKHCNWHQLLLLLAAFNRRRTKQNWRLNLSLLQNWSQFQKEIKASLYKRGKVCNASGSINLFGIKKAEISVLRTTSDLTFPGLIIHPSMKINFGAMKGTWNLQLWSLSLGRSDPKILIWHYIRLLSEKNNKKFALAK